LELRASFLEELSFTFVGFGLSELSDLVDGVAESGSVAALEVAFMSERIEVDVGLDGNEVEFGVSEDAREVGGLCDVWRCEPFPGDRSVCGAQVFGHHGVAGVVGKELCDVAVEGFARAVMDLFVGEVFAVVGVAQSCEGIEDELRLGQGRGSGRARFGR
jgi:hypothetical protein